MPDASDTCREFDALMERGRPHEAFAGFLHAVAGRELTTPELTLFERVCQETLPQLRQEYTLWLVHHLDYLYQMSALLEQALQARFRPALMVDNIAWLRCLRAVAKALEGKVGEIHTELALAGEDGVAVPPPNGQFHRQVEGIELVEPTAVGFLRGLFDSYLQFLRRTNRHELANTLAGRIDVLLEGLARDEHRPGVVQALFFDGVTHEGRAAFVHVRLQPASAADEGLPVGGTIAYAGRARDRLDADMRQAAEQARQAVDAYLKRTGLPDGLDGRVVHWEIGTLYGDSLAPGRQFKGASIALPLAVAAVSQYVVRAVPNDLAFTGAVSAVSATGDILPVDGIRVKLRQALAKGCKVVYVPTANLSEIRGRPTLANLVEEHHARVIGVDTLDDICARVFPPQGSGRFRDLVRDTAAACAEIAGARRWGDESGPVRTIQRRHRLYLGAISASTGLLVLLEGVRLYRAFAPDYPAVPAWTRISGSAVVVFLALLAGFALPATTLRHRRKWAWYGQVIVSGLAIATSFALLAVMLPSFTKISSLYNAPPVAGLLKDLFVIWVFAWGLAGNTFCVVAALEHLLARRQFITARRCLQWDSRLEARMPIHCVYFSWMWGALVIAVFVVLLLHWELRYYRSLNAATEAGFWEMFLGILRDVFFLTVLAAVMLFYKRGLARVRQALSDA